MPDEEINSRIMENEARQYFLYTFAWTPGALGTSKATDGSTYIPKPEEVSGLFGMIEAARSRYESLITIFEAPVIR